MLKESMPPICAGFFTAVLSHRLTDGFVRAKTCPECFGFGPDTENKRSVNETGGNFDFRPAQPVLLTVEIDQQNHKSVRMLIHSTNVIRFETIQDLGPAARHLEHLDTPSRERLIHEKAIRQLAVGIVFGKHQNVWLVSVDAHGSTSPRTSAPTRSPPTCNSLSGRTTVGSRWLFR